MVETSLPRVEAAEALSQVYSQEEEEALPFWLPRVVEQAVQKRLWIAEPLP